MALLLRESDVRALLPVPEAVRVVREALTARLDTGKQNLPRGRLRLRSGLLHVMAASLPESNSAGLKAYTTTRTGNRFLVALWNAGDGALLALIEADWLGRIRTGAASGVATDLLAREDAAVMGLIGAGRQAQTQLEAIAAVRRLREVRVFCRDVTSRTEFAARMEQVLGDHIEMKAAESARECVEGADIITTITTSREPVFDASWLAPGCHVNAAGSNRLEAREVDTATLRAATLIIVDSIAQARLEAGDLVAAVDEGSLSWSEVRELGQVLVDASCGRRTAGDLTLFKSLGIALEDVAVARQVFDRAIEQGLGENTSFGDPLV